MPCRSYDDEPSYSSSGSRETQNKMDMLARMACRALTALETINAVAGNDVKNTVNIGVVISEVLTDSEVKVWWPKHKAADAAEQAMLKKKLWKSKFRNNAKRNCLRLWRRFAH